MTITPRKTFIAAVFLFLAVLAAFLIFSNRPAPPPAVNNSGCIGLQLKDQCIPLERAEKNPARVKGLSGKESLNPGTGMLFVFDKVTEQCMWMKDMRFSIDMIWLDEEKKIKKIEQNVAPETYPAAFCAEDTKYVIELNSGSVQKFGFAVGQELNF